MKFTIDLKFIKNNLNISINNINSNCKNRFWIGLLSKENHNRKLILRDIYDLEIFEYLN